ncbi:hypothetical protein V8E51_018182 [Hyaloscypha variabilis]
MIARDQWESKRPAYEARISQLLGQAWTVDIDANDAFANIFSDPAKSHIGSFFESYVKGFVTQLEAYVKTYGEEGKTELNTRCSNHSITLEAANIAGNMSCDVKDGNFRILYREKSLGVNLHSVVYQLAAAINAAPLPPDSSSQISFYARQSVRLQYDTKIEEVRLKAASILNTPSIKFTTNFEQIYSQLMEVPHRRENSYWEERLGWAGLSYYKEAFLGLLSQLARDEILVEGFQSSVFQNEICIRIVDKLDDSWRCFDGVIEDGILYIQTTAKNWGSNINSVGLDKVKKLL